MCLNASESIGELLLYISLDPDGEKCIKLKLPPLFELTLYDKIKQFTKHAASVLSATQVSLSTLPTPILYIKFYDPFVVGRQRS